MGTSAYVLALEKWLDEQKHRYLTFDVMVTDFWFFCCDVQLSAWHMQSIMAIGFVAVYIL